MVLPGTTPTTAPDVSPKVLVAQSPKSQFGPGRKAFFQKVAAAYSRFVKGCVERKGQFLERVEHSYEAYGHRVYDHPWRYIIWPLVVCTIFSVGLLYRTIELDMVKLYGLPGCLPHVALEHLQGVFPIERIEYIFAVSRDGILSKEKLLALDQMWTKVKRLRVPKSLMEQAVVPGEMAIMGQWLRENHPELLRYEPDWDSSKEDSTPHMDPDFISLEDVCVYDGFGTCKMTGVLDLYNSKRMYGQPVRTREWPLYVNLRTQRAFRVDSMLGDITTAERPGGTVELKNATSAAFRIDLDGTQERVAWASAWEQGLVAMIQSMELPGIKLHIKAERSLADELALSSQLRGDDLMMLLVAAVLVTIFTCAMNWSTDKYRSKLFPALVGTATTLFSYGGGVGFCHLLGLPHVPPSEATPFIVLAINVDDVFVITNAYSMTYLHSHCSRSRVGMALRDAGISVTLTTVTNIIAFAIGASSVYYSIKIFCVVTATALLVGFLMSLTVFAGALSISAKLEEQNRPATIASDVRAASAAMGAVHRALECKSAARLYEARRPSLGGMIPHSQPAVLESTLEMREMTTPRGGSCGDNHRVALSSAHQLARPADTAIRCRSPSPLPAVLSRRPSLREAGNRAISAPKQDNVRAVVSRRGVCPVGTPAATEGQRQGFYLVEDLSNQYVMTRRVEQYYQLLDKNRGNPAGASSSTTAEGGLQASNTTGNSSSPQPGDADTYSSMRDSAAAIPQIPDEPPSPNAASADWAESPSHSQNLQSYASLALASTEGGCNNNNAANDDEHPPEAALPKAVDIDKLRQLVWIDDMLYPAEAVNLKEPKGTVGRLCREAFLRYVGSMLVLRPVKVLIFTFFVSLFAYSCWCSTRVSAGIKMRDVAPMDSYFRDVIDIRESDYAAYGEECIVFFHHGGRWWDPDVQADMLDLTRKIRTDEHVEYLMSGMEDFLTSSYHRPTSAQLPTDRERKLAFTKDWQEWVESPRGRNYGKFFLRDYDGTPSLMKFYYWMEYTDNSEVSQRWMLRIQQMLQEHDRKGILTGGEVFTPLALMWESDPIIFKATMWNMVVALASMGVVALALIPDMLSGFLVLCVILMIYANVYGFMYLWDLPLNMLTMVNLVLAIGFAVDYTAHITHTFNHCRGRTRNARVIETIVMMGLPITNGMLSTYVALAALAMSTKYTLVVIFKMTTTIIASAFLHGMFFMPVLLSVVGPMNRREVTVVNVQGGAVKDSWAVDLCDKRPVSRALMDTVKLSDELKNFSRWGALNRKNYGVI